MGAPVKASAHESRRIKRPDPVTCRECDLFTPNETSSDPNAMGSCQVMEDWKRRYALQDKRPPPKAYEAAWRQLGDKLCWPDVERICLRFVGVAK